MYTEKVMNYFLHPKNMGEISSPDGVGKVGNQVCGDVMFIYIKVGIEEGIEYIEDVKFKTMGCAAAIATSSMATELAKGKSLDEAEKITNKDVSIALGRLPPIKEHCSNLASEALTKVIDVYRAKK